MSPEVRGGQGSYPVFKARLCKHHITMFGKIVLKGTLMVPGSSPPPLVLETPILESQEIDVGRYNGETGLLKTL